MKIAHHIILLVLLVSCGKDSGSTMIPVDNPEDEIIYFVESDEHFANPERGFYRYSETRASNYNPLSLNTLRNNRELTGSSGSSYQTYNTLVFRYFVLDEFTDSPISDDFLSNMEDDFETIREAGVKIIVRFAYTISAEAGSCPESFICPPYGDAPKEIVLNHIDQLGPVLTENTDVIHVIQMGFIGTWGENYYTDYFGDASSNGENGQYLDEDWSDRIEVLQAILDNTPDELMVQVRYPQMKQRIVYGIDATTSSAAMTKNEAFDGSDKARVAFHNDCLFASAADFGTYEDYGNSTSPRRTDIANLKSYFADDSKYVVVGGETCSDGYSPQNDCAPDGMADEDLRLLHYTYLNADYNNQVNNDWVDGGCMDDIRRNLGYRIVLDSALIENEVDDNLKMILYLRNIGYASPIKDYLVDLVLTSEGVEETVFSFDTDVRFWFDDIVLGGDFDVSGLSSGEYALHLFIHDHHSTITNRPEYAIRLANDDLWQEETGYNTLSTIGID